MEPFPTPGAGNPQGPNFTFSDVQDGGLGDFSESLGNFEGPTPAVEPGAVLPGDGSTPSTLKLSAADRAEFEAEIPRILSAYDSAMGDRWRREEEIEDAYAMIPDGKYSGAYQGASRMVSEQLMATVDQAKSRLCRGLLEVTPLIRVTPIESANARGQEAVGQAKSLQQFLEDYGKREVGIEDVVDRAAIRFCKVGTAVARVEWEKRDRVRFWYDDFGGKQKSIDSTGRLRIELVPNRDVVVWPPWEQDWREDCEWVGHRSSMTKSQWRYLAARLGISDELRAKIETYSRSEELSESQSGPSKRNDIEGSGMATEEGMVKIIELWGHRLLAGQGDMPVKFQLFFHEGLRQILWIDWNRLHCQWAPYVPIRYKRADGSSWGIGVGQETFFCHKADTTFRNLEIDNLLSSCHNVVLLKNGSMADAIADRVYPGQRIPTEDPVGDFVVKSLAENGPIAMLYQATQANEYRKTNATGMAPVLSGQGDPTQKSGTGTGATMALIEQAGKKFGDVDSGVRRDLTRLYELMVEIIFQECPDGIFYEHASDEDATILTATRYLPPRGAVSDFFRFAIDAPSAANNKELFKQNLLTLYNFMTQHVNLLFNYAGQIYPQENPAGFVPFLHRLMDFICTLAEKVTESQEVPGLKGKNPRIDPPTPPEQVINQLQQQMQQMMQQMQQFQGQMTQGAGAPQGQPGLSPVSAGDTQGAPAPFAGQQQAGMA